MNNRLSLFCLLIVLLISAEVSVATDRGKKEVCPLVKMEAERLPDLNVPRSGHTILCVNGEPTVIGGHTSGFVLTPTAEYYSDGKWHQLKTVYPHDFALSIVLKSGKVLLAGGMLQDLGIGQIFSAEYYDPGNHQFEGFGCLDVKRAYPSATEIDSGRVVISGNWYHDDAIECFDGQNTFTPAGKTSQSRPYPYILRTAKDDAIIFGAIDEHGKPIDSIIVDRLHSEPFSVPMFKTWHPIYHGLDHRSQDCLIGDEEAGDYRYLLPVVNKDQQWAVTLIRDTVFQLIPTIYPIPMESQWGPIHYIPYVIADRDARKAYLVGLGDDNRYYALCLDYASIMSGQQTNKPLPVTLYYSDPQKDPISCSTPVLTPDGDLVLAGGAPFNNFNPVAAVYRLAVGTSHQQEAFSLPCFLYWLLGGIVLFSVLFLTIWWRNRKFHGLPQAVEVDDSPAVSDTREEMIGQICQLMEDQQIFLKPDLKVSDIAAELGINSGYISECIKSARGCSFTQFVNHYRINYAQQLMRENPEKKLMAIATESGFTTESTFFRAFKSVTGMPPKEWKSKNDLQI